MRALSWAVWLKWFDAHSSCEWWYIASAWIQFRLHRVVMSGRCSWWYSRGPPGDCRAGGPTCSAVWVVDVGNWRSRRGIIPPVRQYCECRLRRPPWCVAGNQLPRRQLFHYWAVTELWLQGSNYCLHFSRRFVEGFLSWKVGRNSACSRCTLRLSLWLQ